VNSPMPFGLLRLSTLSAASLLVSSWIQICMSNGQNGFRNVRVKDAKLQYHQLDGLSLSLSFSL
jgi:hypothetical protein